MSKNTLSRPGSLLRLCRAMHTNRFPMAEARTKIIRTTAAQSLACLTITLVLACSSSEPENGKVICGSGPSPCPSGYQCGVDTRCWKTGTGPDASLGNPGPDAQGNGLDGYADRGGEAGATHDLAAEHTGGALDVAAEAKTDVPLVVLDAQSPGADAPIAGPEVPDAPVSSDVHSESALDAPGSGGCPAGKVSCGDKCIDPAPTGCCSAADCAGTCMTCGANNTCVQLRNQDDPTNRCTGTCDSIGDCRSKKGQPCQSVGGACAGGLFCSPDGVCCDKECKGSCEACNGKGVEGTCTTLAANEVPHAGHGSCAGDGVCSGSCTGASAACTYPTGACGTAECKADGYHGAGSCKAGSCTLPSTVVCANVCDVSVGGCTGVCKPDAVQCSQTNVPQKCTASGAWKDQTPCASGYTCTAGSCQCESPKAVCNQACIDVSSDPKNCGTCGHDCLGGSCTEGKCQPVAVISSLGSSFRLLGIDAQNLYYSVPGGSSASYAYQIGKTPGGLATLACEQIPRLTFLSVIGNYLLQSPGYLVFTSTMGATGTCMSGGAVQVSDNGNDQLVSWGSLQPQLFAMANPSPEGEYGVVITWYQPGAPNDFPPRYYGTSATDSSLAYRSFFQYGAVVYGIRDRHDSTTNQDVHSLVYVNSAGAPITESERTAGLTGTMAIVDVNAQSVLFWDAPSTDGIFSRVTVTGSSARQTIATLSPAPTSLLATEDDSGLYWFDGGNVKRCSTTATGCSGAPVTVATGQHGSGYLYRDEQALYWADQTQGAIIKLAK